MVKRGTGKKVDHVKINRNKKMEADQVSEQAAQLLSQQANKKDCNSPTMETVGGPLQSPKKRGFTGRLWKPFDSCKSYNNSTSASSECQNGFTGRLWKPFDSCKSRKQH